MVSTVRYGSPQSARYIDEMYALWRSDPAAVDRSWQIFFEGYDLGQMTPGCLDAAEEAAGQARRQSRVASLIYAYRSLGHRVARVDPLGGGPTSIPQLELSSFQLSAQDLERTFDAGHLHGPPQATLQEIIDVLRDTYCRSVGVEYIHMQDVECRRWLQAEMEPCRNRPTVSRLKKLEILRQVVDASLFETFIGQRYPGQKRFSLEGAETAIPAVHFLLQLAGELGVEEVVIGMAHRGRLNMLANILGKSYAMIFAEFEENLLPFQYGGDGDVKYHKGYSSDFVTTGGRFIHLSLAANPSHLEAVNPVVEGRARAKQRRRGDTARRQRVVPLLLHGDAAFAGQGLVAETLNLSQLPGYATGGTVHLIVNNQIGFTTMPSEARSTRYATDVAKAIEAPIFHVNGDDPEAVVHVMELALRFRQSFSRDVVVDMLCYRRHGHNEGDEPAFTQPLLYNEIERHPPVLEIYTRELLESGDLAPEQGQRITAAFKDELQRAWQEVRRAALAPPAPVREAHQGVWEGLEEPFGHDTVDTGVPHEVLLEVGRALAAVPEGFSVHRKVARLLRQRRELVEGGGEVDWALAEALAMGSLLLEGIPVRLSGQDSARGTFSQRHAVLQDVSNGGSHTPLKQIRPSQASFCVYNSLLSEAAVLGFDYGYSLDEPNMLILWEAQFGDFANGAQVIIDQFIVSSVAKWQRQSGLTMLLPHGYEGQGPEHSNAYLERYLMACAEENIQVCCLSTPAQYFHALRRQVRRPFRRPLVLMAPKSLLRHPRAVSLLAELEAGGFSEVLDDPTPPEASARLLLCTGKVYYDLLARREELPQTPARAAIVRVEQLYPLCCERLERVVRRHASVQELCWVQEEPQNRGAWAHMSTHLRQHLPELPLRYVGRPASASPATGSLARHRREQAELVDEALGAKEA